MVALLVLDADEFEWPNCVVITGTSSIDKFENTPPAHLGVVELLILDAGADCRMRDREGRRPMDMTTLEEVRFRDMATLE